MLNRLKNLFNSPVPSEVDIQLAAATLMFELIRSDGTIDALEHSRMLDILRGEFNLNQQELDELFENAQQTAENAISLQGFTRQICDNWDNVQRIKLLEYLWQLAFADNTIDPHERHLVRKIAGLLYLNDKEIIRARERAKHHTETS